MLYIKDNIIKDSNLITIETENSIIYNPDHDTLLSNGWEVYKEESNTKIIKNKGFVKTTSEEFGLLDKSVYEDSIVFIEDAKQIWSNGIYYGESNSQNSIDITYSELKTLRDNSQLIPGMQYRIIDYVTTTIQENTQSANNQFDIIVTADSENTLNENAHAIQCAGDTYFSNSNLNAWELKYSLDNDTNRFEWVDTTNGVGVIYYMKDEYGNECPYDFKNIKFLRSVNWFSEQETWCNDVIGFVPNNDMYFYTFSWLDESNNLKDLSIIGNELLNHGGLYGVFNNIIKSYSNDDLPNLFSLSNNIFVSSYYYDEDRFCGCYSNYLGNNSYSNTFGCSCYQNLLGNSCVENIMGVDCCWNVLNDDCGENSFGSYSYYNSLGISCYNNKFTCAYYNSLGHGAFHITLGAGCSFNNIHNDCSQITFGEDCYGNVIGEDCKNNSFGNYFSYNSLGCSCNYNSFRTQNSQDAALKDYCQYNHLDDGCSYNIIYNTTTSSSKAPLKNVHITRGVSGSSPRYNVIEYNIIEIPTLNNAFETKVAKKSNGKTVIYNEADLIADQN